MEESRATEEQHSCVLAPVLRPWVVGFWGYAWVILEKKMETAIV